MGGLIAKVSPAQSQRAPDGTLRVDARGGSVVPGMVDTHCHPFELGWLKRSVDLRGTANITGLKLRVSANVQRTSPGEWVMGMGWDQEAFSEGRYPTKDDIDEVSPDNPVMLNRVCGHIALVNSKAIRDLGLESGEGEEYARSPDGTLTGIIKEKALADLHGRIPRGSGAVLADDLASVDYEAARSGLTALHCVVSPEGYREELEALALLKEDGRLSLRYRVYIPTEARAYVKEKGLRELFGGDRVRINGVKLFTDGSLGAGTAALREPYTDEPSNSGILRHSDEELTELVEAADSEGYQVTVHAIGDKAVEQAIESLAPFTSGGNPRRHRIEHASLAPKDLRAKMRKYGIRAAVQPSFIVSDSWATKRLGDRAEDLYPFKSMLEEGICISGGSDAPVETISPVIGIWAAMARAGYGAGEELTLEEALALYTANAAENGFDEGVSGAVQEGMTADLVVLDCDVSGMHHAMVRKAGVAATVVGGEVAYSFEGVGTWPV